MSSDKKRAFRLSPEARDFVGGAKVQTDTAQHDTAQHSTNQQPALPWEDLSAGGKTINFKFSPEQYARAMWCKQNVPGGASLLELLRMGLDMVCNDLIQKHYKQDDEK